MKSKVFSLLMFLGFVSSTVSGQILFQDGLEGPWYLPENTMALNSGGGGFDEDWFVDHVDWVGDAQFALDWDESIKTEGKVSQKANSAVNDGNIRDLYLARWITNVEAGETYTISLDYRFDRGDRENYIQYTIRDGDQQTRAAIADIEQYPGHDRPDTRFVDASTFDDESFHTLTATFIPSDGQDSVTLMMIIRFWSSDLEQNWFWLDNLVVEKIETTNVNDWSLY